MKKFCFFKKNLGQKDISSYILNLKNHSRNLHKIKDLNTDLELLKNFIPYKKYTFSKSTGLIRKKGFKFLPFLIFFYKVLTIKLKFFRRLFKISRTRI